jgi:hypothetical protein
MCSNLQLLYQARKSRLIICYEERGPWGQRGRGEGGRERGAEERGGKVGVREGEGECKESIERE